MRSAGRRRALRWGDVIVGVPAEVKTAEDRMAVTPDGAVVLE